ncbi:MAG: hypothetical protein IKJ30_05510 [Bacilli bacterium]|nr:hypothetical protein [Bacilli bacterium]
MQKRYFVILSVLITLVGIFFLFFDEPSNEELYNKYYSKIVENEEFVDVSGNSKLNVALDSDFINNKYHYVITFTSNQKLNNFKVMAVDSKKDDEYYPSFGIFDNQNINLVNTSPGEGETRGVNLVISDSEEIASFEIYVSYDGYEFYYLLEV